MSEKKAYLVVFHDINREVILGASNETEAIEQARKTFKQVIKQEYNGSASARCCEESEER